MTNPQPSGPEASIPKMTPREHIRRRPGMYIGGIDQRALHTLVFGVLDYSANEALNGECDHIWITLRNDNEVTVQDNGKGIPVRPLPDGRRLLEAVMTEVSAWRPTEGRFEITGYSHGIGLGGANPLMAECTIEVAHEGHLWTQSYREGNRQSDVIQVRPLEEGESNGTSLTFRPDFTIFEPNDIQYELLVERAHELTYLIPGLTITLSDAREQSAKQEIFYAPNGLADFVTYLNQGQPILHAPISGSEEWTIQPKHKRESTASVNIALQYTDTTDTKIHGYVNTIRTDSGIHINTLPFSLLQGLQDKIEHLEQPLATTDMLPGLTAIVSVWHTNPAFANATNSELINPEVSGLVVAALHRKFPPYEEGTLERIVQKLTRTNT
jgi:DNA gyrase subunit B